MKKCILVLALFSIGILLTPVGYASLPEPPIISKSFDVEEAGLCDHVTGEIEVTTFVSGVVVTDEMPEGLALVNVTVAGGDYDLDFNEDMLEVTLNEGFVTYTISIEVQVTDVLSYDSLVVVNTAVATDSIDPGIVRTASDDLELLPYTCFNKYWRGAWLDDWFGDDEVEQDEIPLNTKVYFMMYIDGGNCLPNEIDMLDAYVKDNLGGDLEFGYWETSQGSAEISKLTGKTEKAHLLWEMGDLLYDEGFISDLAVSTDENTGNGNGKKGSGHQEYTEEGTHYLNSGATLKFTASDTGFTCSVSDEGIEVEVVVPD